ncbi:hypothetical protein ABEY43_26710 [Priestia megaterium]|uniref:hypothetical protein n=1 Tax=Priestia megaterium TaxID=1404 RepID=UPI002E1C5730|nr:hypothetical protein [Priestia megaterium]
MKKRYIVLILALSTLFMSIQAEMDDNYKKADQELNYKYYSIDAKDEGIEPTKEGYQEYLDGCDTFCSSVERSKAYWIVTVLSGIGMLMYLCTAYVLVRLGVVKIRDSFRKRKGSSNHNL